MFLLLNFGLFGGFLLSNLFRRVFQFSFNPKLLEGVNARGCRSLVKMENEEEVRSILIDSGETFDSPFKSAKSSRTVSSERAT